MCVCVCAGRNGREHLDWVDESLAADAGQPADDAADGQSPVVAVCAAPGGVAPTDGVVHRVLLLSWAWEQVERDLLVSCFPHLRLVRHDWKSRERGEDLVLKQEAGTDPALPFGSL